MKRLSLQWRITLLTALLIACACVCMNLLLYRTGVTGMDALNGFMMQYQPGSADSLTIEIPQEEMSSLLAHFSQEVYDAKVVFGRKGWCITAVVTIVSAAIAYFVSGRALKPLQQLAQQAQRVDQDSIATARLDEDTVQEFRQLSRSVNRMLDGLAQSFELQRQFAGNAAHELRTPLAILQTKLELFAEEHPAMDAETAGLVSSLREQLDRLTALVRTLLEMSNLQSVSRTDQIALAPLVEEILTDLTPLAQKNNISLQQDCAELGMVGSDALIYRLVFNLVENGIKYNRPGGAVRVTLRQEKQAAVLRVADTGPGIPADCRDSIFQLAPDIRTGCVQMLDIWQGLACVPCGDQQMFVAHGYFHDAFCDLIGHFARSFSYCANVSRQMRVPSRSPRFRKSQTGVSRSIRSVMAATITASFVSAAGIRN